LAPGWTSPNEGVATKGEATSGVHSRSVAFEAMLQREGLRVYLILNAFWRPLVFELPPIGDRGPWCRWIDTTLESPQDVVPRPTAPVWPGATYRPQSLCSSANIGRGETSR
jgi:isoamylase